MTTSEFDEIRTHLLRALHGRIISAPASDKPVLRKSSSRLPAPES
jgi:hypothetical protein